MENNEEIKINLETLYELLRIEKNKNELQKLPSSFYSDIIDYLETKKSKIPKGNVDTLLSINQRNSILQQINNINQIIQQLYERREKKILELALNDSKKYSNKIKNDENHYDNLLPQEKELYELFKKISSEFRIQVLNNILNLKEPPKKIRFSLCTNPENQNKDNQKGTITVRFISSTPKFLANFNNTIRTYGPFKEDDIATLPIEIANQLLKKQRVEKIKL